MHIHVQSQIEKLSVDIYDYLLREAGYYADPAEWFEIAAAVADRLREEIILSRDRNAPLFPTCRHSYGGSYKKPTAAAR